MNNLKKLKEIVCSSLCTSSSLREIDNGYIAVSSPFSFPDGDAFSIYLKPLAGGGYRITDLGHTFMHLSYEMDTSDLRKGSRKTVLDRIISESGITEEDGEIYIESMQEKLGENLFHIGQALTRIHDVSFLNRHRVESTFYDDLYSSILDAVPNARVIRPYSVPGMTNTEDYPVDFYIEGKLDPLFLFGVPNKDKVRLVTIELQHFMAEGVNFDSIIVFADQQKIPRTDLARL